MKVIRIFLFVALLVPVAQAGYNRFPVEYVSPDGAVREIDVLFGISGKSQDDIEYVPNPDYPHKKFSLKDIYVSSISGFAIRWTKEGYPVVLIPPKAPQEVDFSEGLYRLKPSKITIEEFRKLPKYDKHKLRKLSDDFLQLRDKYREKPNASYVYRVETVQYCGVVKFVYGTDDKGEYLYNKMEFERHGVILNPLYEVNRVSCSQDGKIIVQFADFEATGGKNDYIKNEKGEYEEAWDYRPAIAIIDTGIPAIETGANR